MKILDETGLKFIATKFKELRDSLNNKVDKVTGKDLSTNDYTNEAKAKVDAIPADPKYTDTIQDLSGYLKKSDVFDDKTFSGDQEKLRNIPLSASQGIWLWNRLDRIAPDGFIDLDKIVPKISIQDREPYWDNNLQGLLLSGALDELFLRTTKLNERKADKTEIKTKLSEMTDDVTHRLVTDTEKTTWNNKIDSVSGKLPDLKYNTLKNLKPGFYVNISEKLATDDGTLENYNNSGYLFLAPDINGSLFVGFDFLVPGLWVGITDNDKKRVIWLPILDCYDSYNVREKLKEFKQQVILTQAEYDKLSSANKNDGSKIYFIKE